ncbi:MAG: hypothetical protein EOP88_17065 [Verrucomicrobiaceae bacterium]|nr:MAG: hypothetical protein EOP88_17065 [Verrucomicrobiaceae bacterium]
MNTTATLQYCPTQHPARAMDLLLMSPEQWLPAIQEVDLPHQVSSYNNERITWRSGLYTVPPVATNTSAVCFL